MSKGKRIQFRNKYNSYDCELVKQSYSNGRTALELVAWEDDHDRDLFEGEPIATCTVNILEIELEENEVLIKDYSENEGMLQSLLDAGIVKTTGKVMSSGFVTIPVCVLID